MWFVMEKLHTFISKLQSLLFMCKSIHSATFLYQNFVKVNPLSFSCCMDISNNNSIKFL